VENTKSCSTGHLYHLLRNSCTADAKLQSRVHVKVFSDASYKCIFVFFFTVPPVGYSHIRLGELETVYHYIETCYSSSYVHMNAEYHHAGASGFCYTGLEPHSGLQADRVCIILSGTALIHLEVWRYQ